MLQKIIRTNDEWTGFILRMTIGLILFPHGAQKMLGWFDGPGFNGEMAHLTEAAGLSWFTGFMVIMTEFFGSLMLIAGLATRIASVGVGGLFIGIIMHGHWQTGFFMDWFGTNPEPAFEGFEYHLLVIGICTALLTTGGGRWSVDARASR